MTSSAPERQRLLPGLAVYTAALTAVMVVFHVTSTLGDGVVDVWSVLTLVGAAVVIAIGAFAFRSTLTRTPFAFFVFHVISYVVVCGSIAVHAFLADWTGTWGGGLVWMVGLWSLGLLVHAFASVAQGGFADADA